MKRALLVTLAVLVADQALKLWIKLGFFLGESRPLFGQGCRWAYLQFVENRGMAFGLEFGGTAGKLILTLFRIGAVIGIGYVLWRVIHRGRSKGLVLSLSLIFAGALGNIIDSTFYGLLFSESLPFQKAVLLPADGGYAPLLHGAVVDMFYFPLWQGHFPAWLPIWGGQEFEFFRPVFNLADAAISVGVVLLIIVQRMEERSMLARKLEPSRPEGTGPSFPE
ncbi:MAG: lipoprotein signal peptidase [Flavobacteriales bacterium]